MTCINYISDTSCCVGIHLFMASVERTVDGREAKPVKIVRSYSSLLSKMECTSFQIWNGRWFLRVSKISSDTFLCAIHANDTLLRKYWTIHGLLILPLLLNLLHHKYSLGMYRFKFSTKCFFPSIEKASQCQITV